MILKRSAGEKDRPRTGTDRRIYGGEAISTAVDCASASGPFCTMLLCRDILLQPASTNWLYYPNGKMPANIFFTVRGFVPCGPWL
jgi:hypothetical protein